MSTGGWSDCEAAIAELVRLACIGNSRFAAIEAPAGYGKTRLLDRVRLHAHAAGMQVLIACATGSVSDRSFAIPRALFAPMLAANGFETDGFAQQAIDDPTAAAQLFGQLAIGLAREQPLCLAIDDAHLADRASADWLAELVRQADRVPLLVVLAARRRPSGAGRGLIDRTDVTAIRPVALTAAEARARADDVLGVAARRLSRSAFAVTAGLPYLVDAVLEAVAASADPRAGSDEELVQLSLDHVAAAVRARIGRAGGGALAVAQAAAVLEADAERNRVATVSGLAPDEVATIADTLADDGFVVRGWPLHFAHAVVERAVRASLTAAERSILHARAATVLSREQAAPESIGRHVMQAEPEGVLAWVEVLRALARAASARDESELAVSYLRRALREPPGPLQLPAVTLELGRVEARIAPAAAIVRLQRAAGLCAGGTLQHEALSELGHALVATGQFEAAAAVGERLVTGLGAGTDPTRLEGLAQLVTIAQLATDPAARTAGRLVQMTELVARGVAAATGPLAALAFAELGRGGDRSRVLSLGARALDHAAGAPRASVLLALRALDGAGQLPWTELADADCERVRLARVALGRGDLRRVTELVGCGLSPDVDANVTSELVVLGTVAHLESGSVDEARALLMTIAPLDANATAGSDAMALYARGRLRLVEGSDKAAVADLLAAGERLVAAGVVNPAACGWRGVAAIALTGRGDAVTALALAADEVTRAEAFGVPRPIGRALVARGLVLGGGAGLADLARAVEVLGPTADCLGHGQALLALGGAQRRAGQRRAARETLFLARQRGNECGAQPLVAAAEAELGLCGARLVQRPQRGAAALTPAERRVATMAAAGATNAEVARALFLSTKTVEMHLSRAYRKLRITRRRDLPAALNGEAA